MLRISSCVGLPVASCVLRVRLAASRSSRCLAVSFHTGALCLSPGQGSSHGHGSSVRGGTGSQVPALARCEFLGVFFALVSDEAARPR